MNRQPNSRRDHQKRNALQTKKKVNTRKISVTILTQAINIYYAMKRVNSADLKIL